MDGVALRRLSALMPGPRLLREPVQLAAYESDGLTAFRERPLAVAIRARNPWVRARRTLLGW